MQALLISKLSQRLLRALCVGLCGLSLAGASLAEVPNKAAKPAYAEEQTIMQTEQHDAEPGFGSLSSGKVHMDRHYLGAYNDTEGTVLLQRGGNTWRILRNGPIAMAMGTLLLVTPLVIFGFYLGFGPARTIDPPSGRRLQRFSRWQRMVHWATAYSFIALALTGLIITFGKKIIMPWLGHDAYSWVAIIGKYIHNFVGPLFIVCSVLLFITFVKNNFFRAWDWPWLKQLGGLVNHKHPDAGYFNAGEKIWFWGGVVLLGLVMSVSGLVLDFTNFGQTRYLLQIANYLHIGGASLYIFGAMGHIYLGTLGTPGAYEAMRHGTVDASWAKSHHRIWHDEVAGQTPPPPPARPATDARGRA
ncbi:formate dehydrogenase subunit gamma [Massilia sp. PWRC2]|uniref:formate dehydrogenase subunit gamma n=1 Tax=Massilia sp. PWRC2 TaxID=2804626 RepID=UPI003CE9F585